MNLNARGRSRIRGAAMWLLLLELRTPLITLIVTYAISVLGLVLIPGDARGFRLPSFFPRCILPGEFYSDYDRIWRNSISIYSEPKALDVVCDVLDRDRLALLDRLYFSGVIRSCVSTSTFISTVGIEDSWN